ncbi:uncharacterized protein VP01_3821g3 [Puccinia sorghi]|uniref:HAT C-terminal dimerisation domain-containing protein n=1 Tax=Puccinia sorghi TaxID=27349 RepID=A0A0L6UTD8_9BASI|nr:uncharacterized protein VP01_3821g3 [Puccinia sorghi]
MKEITFSIPHVIGSHSGENFAKLSHKELERFICTRKLFSITADNLLTNNKMAKWVKKEIPTFNHKEDLLGCVNHVIKLAAKAALATFGPIDQEEDDEELPSSMMDL